MVLRTPSGLHTPYKGVWSRPGGYQETQLAVRRIIRHIAIQFNTANVVSGNRYALATVSRGDVAHILRWPFARALRLGKKNGIMQTAELCCALPTPCCAVQCAATRVVIRVALTFQQPYLRR